MVRLPISGSDSGTWGDLLNEFLQVSHSGTGKNKVIPVSVAYAASITPDADATDVLNVGTLTGNITIANPSGTPTDGQTLKMRFIQDGNGSHTITWGGSYAFGTDITTALIPSTSGAKWEMVFEWNATDSKWRAVAIARGY